MASADRPLTLHDLPEELLPLLADLLVGKQSSLAWGFHDQALRADFWRLRAASSRFAMSSAARVRYVRLRVRREPDIDPEVACALAVRSLGNDRARWRCLRGVMLQCNSALCARAIASSFAPLAGTAADQPAVSALPDVALCIRLQLRANAARGDGALLRWECGERLAGSGWEYSESAIVCGAVQRVSLRSGCAESTDFARQPCLRRLRFAFPALRCADFRHPSISLAFETEGAAAAAAADAPDGAAVQHVVLAGSPAAVPPTILPHTTEATAYPTLLLFDGSWQLSDECVAQLFACHTMTGNCKAVSIASKGYENAATAGVAGTAAAAAAVAGSDSVIKTLRYTVDLFEVDGRAAVPHVAPELPCWCRGLEVEVVIRMGPFEGSWVRARILSLPFLVVARGSPAHVAHIRLEKKNPGMAQPPQGPIPPGLLPASISGEPVRVPFTPEIAALAGVARVDPHFDIFVHETIKYDHAVGFSGQMAFCIGRRFLRLFSLSGETVLPFQHSSVSSSS